MLALPISALRPSSTPRVPQTRRNTATLDAVGEFRAAAGFLRPKDVYWNNLELVDALSQNLREDAKHVSEKPSSVRKAPWRPSKPRQPRRHFNKPWKGPRIYYDARRVWTPEDAVLGALGGEVAEHRPGLWAGQPRKALPLEAAFVNLRRPAGPAARHGAPRRLRP